MHNTAFANIDLSAIQHNLGIVRRLCPDSRIMAMIKADAYGHGMLRVAKALAAADGLAVARLDEALALRRAGIAQRILLLATLLDADDLALCSSERIDVTAHDAHSVAAVASAGRDYPLRVWLKLDSGMHRIGLDPAAFVAADRQLSALPAVTEIVHMTHFSDSEVTGFDKTERQLQRFADCHCHNSRAAASVANSAAIIARPESRVDWVRPGIMLYGCNPLETCDVDLRPAMTLISHVVAVREIGSGEPVGYNERWVAARASRIATVGIGYGDGYPRHAPNGTPVLVGGVIAPLVGRVSMDSICVDVTDCPRTRVGDPVVLWGRELSVATVASCAGTISYELFAGLGSRATRVFDGDLASDRAA